MKYVPINKSKLRISQMNKDLDFAYHVLLTTNTPTTVFAKLNAIETISKYIQEDSRHLEFLKHIYVKSDNVLVTRKLAEILDNK